MTRLNQDQQNRLQPKRIEFAKNVLIHLGYEITFESETEIRFQFNGSEVKFFPYSGWHSGKTIRDGRGLENLLRQIRK